MTGIVSAPARRRRYRPAASAAFQQPADAGDEDRQPEPGPDVSASNGQSSTRLVCRRRVSCGPAPDSRHDTCFSFPHGRPEVYAASQRVVA